MVNRKTGTFSIEVKKSVDKGVSYPKSRMCTNTHKQALFRWSPRVCQGKYSAGRIYSAMGLLHLAQWCTGFTWGFYSQNLFALHAGVCVCLCVWAPYLHRAHVAEYGRDSSPMILFYYLPIWEREWERESERERVKERERERGIQVCVWVCVWALCIFKA